MDLGLTGKNAVVTGGSKGIGRSIAITLAAEGANVAICARGQDALRDTEKELGKTGVRIYAEVCDVGDTEKLNTFLDNVKTSLGSVDILINNVSALRMGDDLDDWQSSVDIDLMASVHAVKKVLPWMKESKDACILFISSISALETTPPIAYSAAKAAIISYSKNLAVQLAPEKIRVNTIAPGSVEFPGGIWDNIKNHDRPLYDMAIASSPWGRMGTPEEIARVAAFLVSPAASWVTGSCISVDGAQHKSNL